MCGILGGIKYTGGFEKKTCYEALNVLQSRGPDSQRIVFMNHSTLFLGHARLGIIGGNHATQPIVNSIAGISICVNGEIYNYHTLKSELEKEYTFITKSDSEIIIPLYKKYGINFFSKLKGEFAIALRDHNQKKLLLGRDRMGVKPLVYRHNPLSGDFLFGSKARALFKLGIPSNIDTYSLYHSLCFQYQPTDRTFFKDIFQVKPGTVIQFQNKTVKEHRYRDLTHEISKHKITEKHLLHALENSVIRRLQADPGVTFGFHISGGIDSSLIAAISQKHFNSPLSCYTVSYPNNPYDEYKQAEKTCKHIGSNLYKIEVTPEDIISHFTSAISETEGLSINKNIVAKYIMNRKISQDGNKVILTGEGSDELFLGYIHLQKDAGLSQKENKIIADHFVASGSHLGNGEGLPLDHINKTLGYTPTRLTAKATMGKKFSMLLSSDITSAFSINCIQKEILSQLPPGYEKREKSRISSYLWSKYSLCNYILHTLADGCEMAHSIEGRVPFLDSEVISLATSIPQKDLVKDGYGKYLLRKASEKYLTKEISRKKKQPFMLPPLIEDTSSKVYERTMDLLHSSNETIFDHSLVIPYITSYTKMNMYQKGIHDPIVCQIMSILSLFSSYG